MWIAERKAIRPRTDEDSAMAYIKSPRFEKREDAKDALLEMILKEIAGWKRRGESFENEEKALAALLDPAVDSVDVGGVRWLIREF
jgi:hypothetical protein